MTIEEHTNLASYTTFRLGGDARYFVDIEQQEDIKKVLFFAKENNLKVFILGDGSNTVFTEKGFDGIVLHIQNKGIALEKEDDTFVYVRVSSGENWDAFVLYALTKKWYGLENLSYIPGTVGASPVQNIGAYGAEVEKHIVEVESYDKKTGTFVTLSHDDCVFTYRSSLFKIETDRYIIISVLFRLEKVFTPILSYKDVAQMLGGINVTPTRMRETIITIRTSKLPDWKKLPTAGSFFKNPEVIKEEGERIQGLYPEIPLYPHHDGYKISAGYLIEHVAHMKGVHHKGVGVYDKHALILVNFGEGTYTELKELVEEIQEKVKEKIGLMLVPEVNIVE